MAQVLRSFVLSKLFVFDSHLLHPRLLIRGRRTRRRVRAPDENSHALQQEEYSSPVNLDDRYAWMMKSGYVPIFYFLCP